MAGVTGLWLMGAAAAAGLAMATAASGQSLTVTGGGSSTGITIDGSGNGARDDRERGRRDGRRDRGRHIDGFRIESRRGPTLRVRTTFLGSRRFGRDRRSIRIGPGLYFSDVYNIGPRVFTSYWTPDDRFVGAIDGQLIPGSVPGGTAVTGPGDAGGEPPLDPADVAAPIGEPPFAMPWRVAVERAWAEGDLASADEALSSFLAPPESGDEPGDAAGDEGSQSGAAAAAADEAEAMRALGVLRLVRSLRAGSGSAEDSARYLADGVLLIESAYELDGSLSARPAPVFWADAAESRRLRGRLVRYARSTGTPRAWLAAAVVMQADGETRAALRTLERAEEAGLWSELAASMRSALERAG